MTKSSNASDNESLPLGVSIEGNVLSVPLTLVRPFADQPRHHFCNVRLLELAGSIKEIGQLMPVEVRQLEQPDEAGRVYELIDGQRRWHACQIAGLSHIRLTVTEVVNPEAQFARSIVSNFGRADHTPMEICRALCRLRDGGLTQAAMAKMLGRNQVWVSNHMLLAELAPSVQELLHPDHPQRIGLKTAVMLASVPPDLQVMLARKIIANSGRGMTEAAARMLIRATADANNVPIRSKGRPRVSVWKTLMDLTKRVLVSYGEYFTLADRDYRITLVQLAARDVARNLQIMRELANGLLATAKRIERQYPDRAALTAALEKCHGGHDHETTELVGDPGVVVPVDRVGGDDHSRVDTRDEQPV